MLKPNKSMHTTRIKSANKKYKTRSLFLFRLCTSKLSRISNSMKRTKYKVSLSLFCIEIDKY